MLFIHPVRRRKETDLVFHTALLIPILAPGARRAIALVSVAFASKLTITGYKQRSAKGLKQVRRSASRAFLFRAIGAMMIPSVRHDAAVVQLE